MIDARTLLCLALLAWSSAMAGLLLYLGHAMRAERRRTGIAHDGAWFCTLAGAAMAAGCAIAAAQLVASLLGEGGGS